MSDMTDQFDVDFGYMIADLPKTATWGGITLTGAFSDFTKADSPEIGGFVVDYDASINVRVSTLPTVRPNVGAKFTIDGKAFVVTRIVIIPDGVEWQFQLQAENR